MTRSRGITVYPMPEAVGGPPIFGVYALLTRHDGEVKMVHYEGVAYTVTDEKPWCWTDYDPSQPRFTPDELNEAIDPDTAVDLADWVRDHNARTAGNFSEIYYWATR